MRTGIRLSVEAEARMRELWPQVVTNNYIAGEIGVSIVTLIKYGKALGLESRQKLKTKISRMRWVELHNKRLSEKYQEPVPLKARKSVTLILGADDMMLLCLAAEKRHTTPEDFCHRIMHTIVKDNLADAVLDDAAA